MQQRFKSNALPGLMLVIIVFWALSAVLMLTGTLGAANRIDERVTTITSDVSPIDTELDTVPILTQVSTTAEQIREAAAPLTGQLADVVDDVGTIDASAKSILVSANEINGKVKTINTSAKEINGTVYSIDSAVSSIYGSASEINGTVHSINDKFVAVNNLVQRIQDNLVGISRQVDVLNGHIRGIKSDTGTISPLVDMINGHAEAIRASPVVLNPANAAVMHQTIMASTLAPPGTAGVPDLGDLLPQLQGLGGPLPSVPLDAPLPLLGLSLLDTAFLGDTGDLLSLVLPR
jgi:methyl-accepting chemotaxis protein